MQPCTKCYHALIEILAKQKTENYKHFKHSCCPLCGQAIKRSKQITIDDIIAKYETDSAEMLKVGAVEPAEEKQQIADLLKELKEYRNESNDLP